MKIGLISDTHNYLDPQVPKLFDGVDHILHAGDIGSSRLITELRQIAPVTAVLGNTDDPGLGYQLTELIELAGRRFLVHHILNPLYPTSSVRERIDREQPQVVVFGHSHRPFQQKIGPILYLNPGYAGKMRFGLERTIAILRADRRIRVEYLKL